MNRIKLAISAVTLLALSFIPWQSGAAQEYASEIQEGFEIVVPANTIIPIILTAYLNSSNTQLGDIVYADTAYPIWIQQQLVIPKGSTIRGTVTEVVRPGRIKGKGQIAIRFDDILLPNGVKRDLAVALHGIHGAGNERVDRQSETVEGAGSTGEDVGTVIGTTSQGAIIGAISDRGRGAGIGAAAGAAVGLVTTLFTRGRDLVIGPGTQFDLELLAPLRFAYSELEFNNTQLNSAQRLIQPAPRNQQERSRRFPLMRGWPF